MLIGCCACSFAGAVGRAIAAVYLPPAGKLYAGVSAGIPSSYEDQTRVHAPVFEEYVTWGGKIDWAIRIADANRSRMMLHISTIRPSGGEVISPGEIAHGRGDSYLLALAASLAARSEPTYVRIMAEMNGYWDPYCAFNANGRSRGRAHSTREFRQAWRRIVIILRGGQLQSVNRQLTTLGMPPVRTSAALLPEAPVAFIWNPQTAGDPDIAANSPSAYFPGARYVDWIGTDFYSKFPNWRGLNWFYRTYEDKFSSKPFMFGEWGMWGVDRPKFVRQFFRWVRSRRPVRMLMYFQGYNPSGVFNLGHYPRARSLISRELQSSRFAPFTPEWMDETPPAGSQPTPGSPPPPGA